MDPETIAAAVSAAVSFFKQQQDTDWKNSVSDKLDLIISKLDVIDAYLHAIPGIFITLLDNQQRKLWATQIQTEVTNIKDLKAASPQLPTTEAEQQRWRNELDTIKTLLEDNMDFANWGFEQFAIVATGIAAASGIAKYAPNQKEFAALVKSALAYYYNAIDPSVSSSFANALAVLISQQTSLSTRIDSYFETFWNSGVGDEFIPPHGPPKSFVYIYKCHGNIQTGVTGEDHASRSDTGGVPFMPGTSGPDAESQGVSILNSAAGQYKGLSAQIASANNCIGACKLIISNLQQL